MLPDQYKWLNTIGLLPRMVQEGLKLYGTLERPGVGSNPTILGWAAEVGLKNVYTADAIPWCGLFMAVVAHRANKVLPSSPLWALGWAKFGLPAGQPRLGDVLTFTRQGGGHVAMYIAEDKEAYHVLGGNQGDKVGIERVLKTRLYRARHPRMTTPPISFKPYVVASNGALSTNEA